MIDISLYRSLIGTFRTCMIKKISKTKGKNVVDLGGKGEQILIVSCICLLCLLKWNVCVNIHS